MLRKVFKEYVNDKSLVIAYQERNNALKDIIFPYEDSVEDCSFVSKAGAGIISNDSLITIHGGLADINYDKIINHLTNKDPDYIQRFIDFLTFQTILCEEDEIDFKSIRVGDLTDSEIKSSYLKAIKILMNNVIGLKGSDIIVESDDIVMCSSK